MFNAFANACILAVIWLCDCTSRVMGGGCKSKVIEEAMKSVKVEHGVDDLFALFGKERERNALEQLL